MAEMTGENRNELIAALEAKAAGLVSECELMCLTSVNEAGYPRTCCVNKRHAEGFRDVWCVTSRRSDRQSKVRHFEKNSHASVCFRRGGDSLTLVGEAEIVTDRAELERLWNEDDRPYFPQGIDDPTLRFIRFHAFEASFWIDRCFETVEYED